MIVYKGHEPKIGKNVFVADSADLIGKVILADNVSVWFQCVLRADINTISVGSNSNIQDHTVIHLSKEHATLIGKNVTIGHSAIIHGCQIEDNVLIGMGACILDGAVIPKNCIVGASSLVTMGKRFEEASLIIGSPARAIRKLTDEEIESISQSAKHYCEYAKAYLNN